MPRSAILTAIIQPVALAFFQQGLAADAEDFGGAALLAAILLVIAS